MVKISDVEVEAPEAFWWKRKWKRLKMRRFHSVSKLLFKFWYIFAD
jgi:hypothetical protein